MLDCGRKKVDQDVAVGCGGLLKGCMRLLYRCVVLLDGEKSAV